ncbi:omega-amidase, chloroplastic-like isoform X2 [Ananas comosus]|uniref:Omega-amidase, chloroplastic-like isoform X2 n=1 Tax=Ananas comosus TaxID=4615 RepID=A0A6P5FCK0_ANACO|nr:omega-amidase, chloroplastic-like isoform X2 [Ananas comosus]
MASHIQKFKIALCQLLVTSDKERNIARARELIEDAALKGSKLIVLPEMWNCPLSLQNLSKYAEDIDAQDSPSISMLSEVAACHEITIIGGSIPEKANGQLFNTCCVLGPDGQVKAKHRKVRIYYFFPSDSEIKKTGDTTFRESDTLTAGDTPTIVDTDVGSIGIGICHDIRFPELAMLYRSRGAHLICYPGAFNMSTGELLWELMQRSRAVDNQLFVATCSPARNPNAESDYMIWGHSSLVGPFGDMIATTGHDEATVAGEIDYSMIHSRRENLSLAEQRRGVIYKTVDVLGQIA